MTSVSNLNERKSAWAVVQSCLASNDDKQQDKYLIAPGGWVNNSGTAGRAARETRYHRRPQPPLHLLPHPPPPRKRRTTRRSNIAPMVALTIALITPVPRWMPS